MDVIKINRTRLEVFLLLILIVVSTPGFAQDNQGNHSISENQRSFKKRVLESTEIDFLTSYYKQDGDNASVTGGIGTEKLTDFTPTIVISIPLNDDDVLTIDAGISAYTSASSSNVDPFDKSAASSGFDDDEVDEDDFEGDDEDDFHGENTAGNPTGSPWVESSGASRQDVWANLNASYRHSSDDRNKIWSANVNVASEYDYTSFGFGGSYAHLFNEKNTEISVKGNIYLDTWSPIYPTELDSYFEAGEDLNNGFFAGIDILDQSGNVIDKNSANVWSPIQSPHVESKNRNTYSLSFSFSQIVSKNAQLSLFLDVIQQDGLLANPMQRVYFGDRANYYIGNPSSIQNYASPTNRDVFQLADDIERLPDTRFKLPVGARFNYFINEIFVLRTYYRYYWDDWGITSHTANVELPIKISDKFTINPSYRYYSQTAADYFAPYEQNLSTQEFYTSDYDLSKFDADQFGIGVKYTDIFTQHHIGKLRIKTIELKYSQYERNTGLTANIISGGIKFVIE